MLIEEVGQIFISDMEIVLINKIKSLNNWEIFKYKELTQIKYHNQILQKLLLKRKKTQKKMLKKINQIKEIHDKYNLNYQI